jgi:Xaa-Pro dipeptidase
MRHDVIERQVTAMRTAGLDAIVSMSPENFAYLTGFLSPTAPIHAIAVLTADGAVSLAVVDMEANTIKAKTPPGTDIAVWREFAFDAMNVLADVLRKRGLAKARIGIELDYFPTADHAALQALLPEVIAVRQFPRGRIVSY